jgi:putative endonuclease
MASHNDFGKHGEQIACDFLENKGFKILSKNWRHEKAEVDLIVKDGSIIVFVEVKTRKNDDFGYPEEAVSNKKQELLGLAADAYIELENHQGEIRFDIIAITQEHEKSAKILHIKDAFFPS